MSPVDRAGPVSEISVSGLENFAMWTLQPGYRDESGMNSAVQMASRCCAHRILHIIIKHPFNCSDAAIRVAKAKIGANVITLCFAFVALFREFRATTPVRPLLISETGLKFLIWTQGEIGQGKRASPVNRARGQRPWMSLDRPTLSIRPPGSSPGQTSIFTRDELN